MTKEEILQLDETEKQNTVSIKNKYGFSDYTPFNAITGSDVLSKGRVTCPKKKASGGFNTTKG